MALLPGFHLFTAKHILAYLVGFIYISLESTVVVSQTFSAYTNTECPSWTSSYVKFHAAERLQARRLILQCHKPDSYLGGLGDRMRGVLAAMRISAANNLILTLNFTENFNLTGKLEPATNGINWLPTEIPGRDHVVVRDDMKLLEKTFASTDMDIELCIMRDPTTIAILNLTRGLEPASETDYPCMWSKLFQPTAELTSARNAALSGAFNTTSTDFSYVAVHLRIGDMIGEETEKRTRACSLLAQLAAQQCSLELSNTQIPDAPALPILFITDNSVLRWGIANHLFYRMVGPTYLAYHIAHTSGLDYMGEYVDLMLLAGAKCLVASHSGFSNIALWWGKHTCVTSVNECIDKMIKVEGAPDC